MPTTLVAHTALLLLPILVDTGKMPPRLGRHIIRHECLAPSPFFISYQNAPALLL